MTDPYSTPLASPEGDVLASSPRRPGQSVLAIADLSLDQLREEVAYWRQTAACYALTALGELESSPGPEQLLWRHSPRQRLREHVATLGGALHGQLFAPCEACPEPVRPGDPVVYFEDVGEMHARCAGATPADIAAGRVSVSIESLNTDDMPEALAAAARADPHLVIYPSAPAFTEARIAEIHRRGRDAVARLEAADEAVGADANAVRTEAGDPATVSQGADVDPHADGARYGVTTSADPDFAVAAGATEAWFTRRARAEGFAQWLDYAAVWDLVAGERIWARPATSPEAGQ